MAILVPEGLKNATQEQLVALLEVMYYVANSDGVFSTEELTHFLNVAETISGGKLNPGELGIIANGWAERDAVDLPQRFTELAQILKTPHEREMACNLAAQLAEADDAVLRPEQDILDLLGRIFFPGSSNDSPGND